MAQIQKLKSGATIEDYNKAKADFEQAYNNADSDTKAWLNGFLESNAKYQAADPINNRSTREQLTQVYTIGQQMAKEGRSNYQAPMASAKPSTKNIFNGYSNEENINNVNEIARKYVSKNSQSKPVGTTMNSGDRHFVYKWNDNWDSGWGLEGETVSDKLVNFTDLLVNNVGNLLNASNNGDIVHGVDPNKLSQYRTAHSDLTSFLQNLKDGKYAGKDLDAVKDLAKLARQVGVDSASFKEYFKDYLPKETQLDKNRKSLESQGYSVLNIDDLGYNKDIADYLKRNKINLMRGSDGETYAFDNQYGAISPLKYINMDWRLKDQENSPFNHGIFTDENGKVWTGDVTTLNTESPYFTIMDEYRKGAKDTRSQLFKSYRNFNPTFTHTDSDLLRQLTQRLKNSNLFAGKQLNFADVSQLFKSDRPIVAINDDNSIFEDNGDDYGNITFDNKTKFYYIGNDNRIHQVDFNGAQTAVGEYGLTGWGESTDQLGNMMDLTINNGQTDITPDRRMSGRSWFGEIFNRGWAPTEGINLLGFTKDIKNNPQAWADVMLQVLATPASKRNQAQLSTLEAFNGLEDPENILVFIQDLIKNGAVEVTPEMYKNWNKVMLESAQRRNKHKNGGILYAAKGQILDIYGNPIDSDSNYSIEEAENADKQRQDLINKTREAGYSDAAQYKANMRKPGETGFTTTDYVRLGAIAADIASIPAAFVAGYGTAVSAGLGVSSSLATLATDIADDGFQLHDISGFGVNLALDVAGLFGGAGKVGKIVKNCAKFAPLLIGAWDAMANGQQYKDLFEKMQKGKSLTVQDWKTLARGVAIVAGGTRAGASSYRQRQIKNNAKLANTEPSYKLTVKKGASTEEISLKPEEVQALQQGDFNAANTKLKELRGIEYDLIPDKNSRLGHGWKGLFVRENSTNNPVTSRALSETEVTPEQMFRVNQNSRYNGLVKNDRSRFANWLNAHGQKWGLASDVDMAGNNVSGRLGLFRGNMASAEPTSAAPTGGRQAVAALLPAEKIQTVTVEPAGFPAIVGNYEHAGNGWYVPRALNTGKQPLALGSKRVNAMQRVNQTIGPSEEAIPMYSSAKAASAAKGVNTRIKNELLSSKKVLSGEQISKKLGQLSDSDLGRIADENGLTFVIQNNGKGGRTVSLNRLGQAASFDTLKRLFYSGRIKIDGKLPKIDLTGQTSLFSQQGGTLDRFDEYLNSHK